MAEQQVGPLASERPAGLERFWAAPAWTQHPPHRSLLTPLNFLYRSMQVFPEQVAVVDGTERIDYGTFAAHVFRLASALQRRGLAVGERVAVLAPNAREVLETNFAVLQAGGVLVPLNIRLSAAEIAYILEHSGARFVVAERGLGPLLAAAYTELAASPQVVWVELGPRHGEPSAPLPDGLPGIAYEVLLAEGSPEALPPLLDDEEAVLSINYTSGTTGRPKGVMVTHRGAYLNALGELIETGFRLGDRYLWTLPMYHCNGWNFPWAVTALAGAHICLPRVEPARIYQLIEQEDVTHLCAAPTVLVMLAQGRPRPDYRFPHPVTIATGGAPPPPAIIAAIESMGARIVHLYGLTETYGPHTVCAWKPGWDALAAEERARLKARQGVGYVHAPELRVVDSELRDVPADGVTLGEVVMRGNKM